ncbi:hypothetical protein NLJ89_g3190 [Agrocybe chaxingu]|uniref:NADH dehydrogenase [ubiquinone] iron-sulfur protein 5 n=1 Tax=Agrocybe chaxingu TaxID=84603 RepID=A0A9W8MXJ3_9AGAR|nr:hypothetical protein NLJ89_g3190 [Agrocybe chaxingu]
MSSGFSWGGGRSRCFTYWQEFQKCYAQTDNPQECRPHSNDYLECLHHHKEIKRAEAIREELDRQVEKHHKEQAKASHLASGGAVAGVGLIQKGKDEEAK